MYYQIIKDFYGDQKAKRSGIDYMQHIDEGLYILNALGASENAKDAFCIHPILQLPESLRTVDVSEWNPEIVLLGMEYRNKANAYSSRSKSGKPPAMILPEVTHMLIADKLQNYKDFLAHRDKYPNEYWLNQYFINWLKHLGFEKYMYMLLSNKSLKEIVDRIREENE